LLLTTLFSGLFLSGSLLKFRNNTGDIISICFRGIYRTAGESGNNLTEKLIPLSVILIMIPAVSFAAIFLYRNRKLQLKITLAFIILVIVLILLTAYYGVSVVNQYSCEIIPGIKMLQPVVTLVLAVLAYRGIKKDEERVRSYDRLR